MGNPPSALRRLAMRIQVCIQIRLWNRIRKCDAGDRVGFSVANKLSIFGDALSAAARLHTG